jgi:hypothetical protein
MEEEYERTLVQLPQVHVFKIPVRKTAEGHRASDWPKDPTWTGKLKIIAKGRLAAIMLMDASNNSVFAVCPVSDDAAVERTLDSGRYFVLRIQNAQGKHAFIGIAFNERNDAFDFNVALQEHKDSVEREEKAAKGIGELDLFNSGPVLQDLSIKEGEKLKINIAGGGRRRAAGAGAGAGGALLAPPPAAGGGSKGLLAPPPADKAFNKSGTGTGAVAAAGAVASNGWESFGATGSFLSGGAAAPAAAFNEWGFTPSTVATTSRAATSSASPATSSVFDAFSSDPFGVQQTQPASPQNPFPW